MTARSPLKDLCDEATCSICLDYFKDPVTITECGHNFCQACLTKSWEQSGTPASCPQCRKIILQRNFIPNRQLASVVEIAQKFSCLGLKRAEEKGSVCEKHQEPRKLFCMDDETPICVVCDRSKQHKAHKVVPLEEASHEYKDQLCSCLVVLMTERDNILSYKADAEKESQDLLQVVKEERQKTAAEFRQLHHFLEEQEDRLLTQMKEVEKEIVRKRDECMARLSRELSSLESIIQDVKEKWQQPASDLLQDIRSTLQRCEKKETFQNPAFFSPALKWKIWEFCDINPFLEGIMKQFKDALVSGLQLQKANITLDPDTAHPKLFLSEDCRSVKWKDKWQDLPDNPERFDEWPFVLGCEGFTTGRHCWEVALGSEDWAVGVVTRSLKRKGNIGLCPEEGVWALGRWAGCYSVLIEPNFPSLSVVGELKRIRVSLNYAGRRMAFFDADTAARIFVYSEASFSGETLCPFFFLNGKAELTLSP